MNVKFSPGPWAIDGNANYLDVINGEGRIAMIDDSRSTGWNTPTVNANARLIAAAPDMYHALQDLIAYLGVDVDNGLDELLTNARDAVAKATGK
jgi:hypothetical protein